MEIYSLESHRRAISAIEKGRFEREIVPMNGLDHDETPRETTLEQMAVSYTHLTLPTNREV